MNRSKRTWRCGSGRGVACPVVFVHHDRDVALAVHGDDFVATGLAPQLTWLAEYLTSCFDIKVRATLGPEQLDDKEVTMLGRLVRWTGVGLEMEADPKHRRLVLEGVGLSAESKALMNNGEPQKTTEDEEETLLTNSESTQYRALCARLNFLAQDSPDLQFPAKELSRSMARPTLGAWSRL